MADKDILLTVKEYNKILETGQYGRFYVINNYPKNFKIYILAKNYFEFPDDVEYDKNALLMYDKLSDGEYGWFYEGQWIDDFNKIVYREKERLIKKWNEQQEEERKIYMERKRQSANHYNKFLNDYVYEEHGIKQDKEYWVVI